MASSRGMATGDFLARESLSFERAFARSRHNACSGCGAAECPGCDGPTRSTLRRVSASTERRHDCMGLWLDGECNCASEQQEAA